MPKITVELDDSDMAELDAEARVKKAIEDADDPAGADSLASRQAARRAALLPAFGMWEDDDSKPKDGVAYQKAIRAEWD